MNVEVDIIVVMIESVQVFHNQGDDLISDFVILRRVFEDVGDIFVSIPIVQKFPVKFYI